MKGRLRTLWGEGQGPWGPAQPQKQGSQYLLCDASTVGT